MSPFALLRFRVLSTLLRTYGVRGLWRRGVHELRCAIGAYEAAPHIERLAGLGTRRVTYRPLGDWTALPREEAAALVARGKRVVAGEYQAFSHEWRLLPDAHWHKHPESGYEFPLAPWWKIFLLPKQADIKDVWEPGRFSWVYDLVRAYAATRELEYATTFHERVAQWFAANPPFRGPHWACGQETAIRALAILHGEDALPAPTSDHSAAERIVTILACSGERIANAIGYGLSQRNNHGISEAAGLIHIGVRLSGVHRDAEKWVRLGRKHLNDQVLDQFARDGWYAQHSFNYMRLALEQAFYAQRTLEAVGSSLSHGALARLEAAIGLLAHLVDTASGVVPNHGANDGAQILPLSLSTFRDFRPLLTLAAVLSPNLVLPADVPLNADIIRWFNQRPCSSSLPRSDGVFCGPSGWAVARLAGWSVFLRAGTYRHRPSHLDALHLDVRLDGREIITDAGTYSYNSPPPWNNGLVSALVHNGPLLDGKEPVSRGPHFLWLSWPRAHLAVAKEENESIRLVANADTGVCREVKITKGGISVRDQAVHSSAAFLQVTWLLHPQIDHAVIDAAGAERIDAVEGDVVGWFSPTYGCRLPSAAIRVRGGTEIETRIARRSVLGRMEHDEAVIL